MFLIIMSLILVVVTAVAIYVINEGVTFKMLFSLGWLLLILFGCFTNIGANTVGIVYDPFNGGIQSKTLTEGYKGKNPLTKIYKISTKVTELNFDV